jgi:hypothetical protein
MSILDTRAARVLVTILCLVLCLAFIYFARQTLVVFCSRSFLLICSRRPSNILNAGTRDHIEESRRSSPPTSCCLVPSRSGSSNCAGTDVACGHFAPSLVSKAISSSARTRGAPTFGGNTRSDPTLKQPCCMHLCRAALPFCYKRPLTEMPPAIVPQTAPSHPCPRS